MSDFSVTEIEGFVISALKQLREAVILVDMNAKLLWANKAAGEIFGYPDGLEGIDPGAMFAVLLTEDDEPYPMERTPLVRALLKQEKIINGRVKVKRRDGVVLVTSGNASPVYDENGKQLGAVLTITDKTARYNAERELKQALEAKEALLLQADQRVRSNLQLISSLIAVQAEDIDDTSARRAMADTERRIQIISELHRSLYQLQIQTQVNVAELLPNLCRSVIQSYSHTDGINFVSACSGVIDLPVADATNLCLSITELVRNACNHAFNQKHPSPEITLKMRGLDKEANLEVSDNGSGIDPSAVDPGRLSINNLMLSTIQSSFGATIETKSDNSGTRVSIRFPLKEIDPEKA